MMAGSGGYLCKFCSPTAAVGCATECLSHEQLDIVVLGKVFEGCPCESGREKASRRVTSHYL